ncbi:unnamed protein product [Malus baccata var. baccata]
MIQNLDSLTNNVPNLSYSMRLSKLQQMWKPLKGLCGEVASLEVINCGFSEKRRIHETHEPQTDWCCQNLSCFGICFIRTPKMNSQGSAGDNFSDCAIACRGSLQVMPSPVPYPNFCRSCSVGICEICNAIKCLLAVCCSGYADFLTLPGSLKQLTKWLELC